MKPGIRDLIADVRQVQKLPEILSERCVHSIIETSNCRACADCCPQGAWLLDDDALRLNTNVCDGCGLCVPACPEGAILSSHEIIVGYWRESMVALCACELVQSTAAEGVIPCIHTIGFQDLLRLHRKGVVEMAVVTADCDSCQRGKGTQLADRLDSINCYLQQAGYTGVKLSRRSITDWQHLQREVSAVSADPQLSRRGFLKGFLNTSLQQGLELFNLFSDQQVAFIPPGQLLPDSLSPTMWPYLPAIDSHRCNGCDACAKLCPHHAIRLEKVDEKSSYQLNPQDCTGCGICVDVCDQQAVALSEWKAQDQKELLLADFKCSCCGNPLHVPEEQAGEMDANCRICSQKNHHKNLYQVLN